MLTKLPTALALGLALLSPACGYQLAGKSVRVLPESVHIVAVPAFTNQTLVPRIEQMMTSAVVHELATRTNYRVQSYIEGSDATVLGAVTSVYNSPTVFDPTTGRTTEALLTVTLNIRVVSATGKMLYQTNVWTYREPYEVSEDPATYLGEDQPALERLSQEVAASLVSTLLEGFQK